MSLDQAPAPQDPKAAWHPDPLGGGNLRWWNGAQWTEQVRNNPGPKQGKKSGWTGKRILLVIGGFVVALIIIGAVAGEEEEPASTTKDTPTASAPPANEKPVAAKQEPAPEPEPTFTAGQENAIQAATDYLDYSSFSKSGLIDQLVYEGYQKKDAQFAVGQLDVNWKQQAYQTAQDYLGYSSFSLSGLIGQLTYDGYTQEQAEYGANKAYNE